MAERSAWLRDWPTLLALSALVFATDAVCVFVSWLVPYVFAVRDSITYLPGPPAWAWWAVLGLSLVIPPVFSLGILSILMKPRRRKQVLVSGLGLYVLMQLAVVALVWNR